MRGRFIITVTDVNGTKSYNISQLFTRFALHVSLFLGVIFILGAISINYLSDEIDRINNKKEEIVQEYRKLESKNANLESRIGQKTKELRELNTKLEDIEQLVGISPAETLDYNERVNLAKLTSLEKNVIMSQIPSGSPIVESKGISSPFGYRIHPILKRSEFHPGLDMRADVGTDVIAPADGVVEIVAFGDRGYGNVVVVHHNYGFKTVYAHLNKVKVTSGDIIKKGEVIAWSGNTGLSSGPHLHYEVRFAGRAIDPYPFVSWTMKNYESLFQKQRSIKWQSLINQIKHTNLSLQEQQSSLNVQSFQGK